MTYITLLSLKWSYNTIIVIIIISLHLLYSNWLDSVRNVFANVPFISYVLLIEAIVKTTCICVSEYLTFCFYLFIKKKYCFETSNRITNSTRFENVVLEIVIKSKFLVIFAKLLMKDCVIINSFYSGG